MGNLINIDNAPSLMEEKARKFAEEEKREVALGALPESQEDITEEVRLLSQSLKVISRELKEAREVVALKEKQFLLLANYKYILEKKLVEPTIITSKNIATLERERRARLFEKMMSLTPEQLDNLKEIKV